MNYRQSALRQNIFRQSEGRRILSPTDRKSTRLDSEHGRQSNGENKKTIFRGVGTALITPMRDGEVDYPALRTLIDRQVELGADALVICGTTGESATLSDTERRRCIASAIEYTDGRVPVIAGTGSNNIEKAASLSRYASDAGADALLVVTPYYNKATPEGLCRSFLHIARAHRHRCNYIMYRRGQAAIFR